MLCNFNALYFTKTSRSARQILRKTVPLRKHSYLRMYDEAKTGGMEFIYWLTQLGKSRTVGWKWRRRGWVKCYRIERTLFISHEEIQRFWHRAASGEFDLGSNPPGSQN